MISQPGAFEGAANAVAKLLDVAADVAEGAPIASVVLKIISFTVSKWVGQKFDVRIDQMPVPRPQPRQMVVCYGGSVTSCHCCVCH